MKLSGNENATQTICFTARNASALSPSSRYDANNNGTIEKSEAVHAVMDYFGEIITKQEAIQVVMAYFTG